MKQRESKLELLRIFSMVLIIMNHYCSTIELTEQIATPVAINPLLKCMLGSWGALGVDIFIIISIWFMCESTAKFNLWKLVQIILETSFYYTLWYILAGTTLQIGTFSWIGFIKALLAPFLGSYWFVTAYICLYLIMPLLNRLVNCLSKEQLKYSILILTVSVIFFFMLQGENAEYGLIGVWSYLFLLVAYLKRMPDNLLRRYSGILGCVLYGIIVVGVYISQQWGITRLQKVMNEKYSFFVILLALCIFYSFEKLSDFSSKFINTIAASTFGVYMFHAGPIAEKYLVRDVANNMEAYRSTTFVLQVVLYAIVILLVGTVIDLLRKRFLEQPLLSVLHHWNWLEKKIRFWNKNWGENSNNYG